MFGGAAAADTVEFYFGLSPLQSVPQPDIPGFTPTGAATVVLDTVTGAVSVSGTYTGLAGNATACHIHGPAAVWSTAGVLIGLTIDVAQSGAISGNGVLSSTNVTNMLNGLTYVNLHTTAAPAGEIRGQVTNCLIGDVTTQGAGVGDPGFGVPDGLRTAADINFFVNGWVAGDLGIGDVTTQGAAVGDPGFGEPDGLTTAADINYFVNFWIGGCP